MSKEKIYKVIQHRGQLMHMNKEIKEHVMESYPGVKDTDMVEILEHRSYQLNNTWETESIPSPFDRVERDGHNVTYIGTIQERFIKPDIDAELSKMISKGYQNTIDNGVFVHKETIKSFRKSNKKHDKELKRENKRRKKNG